MNNDYRSFCLNTVSNRDLAKCIRTVCGKISSETGMTFEEIALQIEISKANIYHWINGESRPNGLGLTNLILLAYECGIDYMEVLKNVKGK